MKASHVLAAVIGTSLFFVLSSPARADLASSFGVFVFPSQGQTADEQAAAEAACFSAAQSRTGVNPMNFAPIPPPAPTQHGGVLRGGAGGAGVGAAIGAIGGNAGQGAAIGAISGGLFGAQRQRQSNQQAQQNAQSAANAQYQAGMNNFRNAFSACMTAKGYVAR